MSDYHVNAKTLFIRGRHISWEAVITVKMSTSYTESER